MPIDDPTAESLAEMPEVTDWSKALRNPYAARLGVRRLPAVLLSQETGTQRCGMSLISRAFLPGSSMRAQLQYGGLCVIGS